MARMTAVMEQPQRYVISADEYLRMGEAGVFRPEARLELIEGEIVEMAPIGSAHASTVSVLTRLFVHRAGDRVTVWTQSPVTAGARSVPQPDVALLKPRADNYFSRHPDPSEVVLLIEVADTTLRFDLATKIPLYARAGIAEVWVVDLAQRAVHIFRGADPGGYRSSFIVAGGQKMSPALPDISLAVSELFPA